MANYSVLASHSQGKSEVDKIFGVNQAANEKAKIVGKENIINATIGAFLDAKGKLITLPTVEEVMRSLPFDELANYAPISGLPEFIEAAIDFTFQEYRPKAYIKGIATPGGTGAIHHAIWNYTEEGDTYLTHDWYWSPYKTMARETLRKLDTFKTFDENNNFNVQDCLRKVTELAQVQRNVLLIINSPAYNPTGYSLEYEEWESVVNGLKELAQSKKNNLILFVDVAYLDFAPPGSRKFFQLFNDLPENIFVIVGFSMSKGYTMYGYRSGCMIGVSSSESVINEFQAANQFSNRGTWSNGTRSAMRVLAEIHKSPALTEKVNKEREEYRLALEERAKIFTAEAKEIGLEVSPYKAGYFIIVPTTKPDEVALKLQEDNIFLVAMASGVRVAICAIATEKIPGMATKIKKAIDALEG